MAAVDEPQSGSRIAGFVLRHRLGVGGMGEVWAAARGDEAGRLVALKLVRSNAAEGRATALFLDEARTATALRHPNIVSTFESGVELGFMYIAMELIRGTSLQRLARRVRRMDTKFAPEAIGRIGVSVADALEYAHHVTVRGRALGLIHRDVSPHNVLVDQGGRPFLTDFGVARSSFQEHQTLKGEIRGKPGYMSPEQVNEERMDHRSDLFSLGIVLWELTTLHRLFKRESLMQSLVAVAHDPAPDVRELRPDAPPRLAEVIRRCLAKSPSDRFASAAEVRDALLPVAKSESVGTERLRGLMQVCFRPEEFDVDVTAPAPGSSGGTPLESSGSSNTVSRRPRPIRESRRAPPDAAHLSSPDVTASSTSSPAHAPAPKPRRSRWLALGLVGLALGVIGSRVAQQAPDAVGPVLLGAEPKTDPELASPPPNVAGSDEAASATANLAPPDPAGTSTAGAAPSPEMSDAGAANEAGAGSWPSASDGEDAAGALTSALVRAAHRGELSQVRAALRAGADPNAHGDGGWTALHAATHRGHLDIANRLLAAGADPNARTEDTGATPLMLAARYGDAALTTRLLEAGADVHATDFAADRALHAAVSDAAHPGGEVVRKLAQAGADLEAEGRLGHTPLVRAAVQGDLDGLIALLDAGARIEASAAGATALWHAAACGQEEIVQELLQRGARRDVVGPTDRDAAAEAEAEGHVSIVRLLHEAAEATPLDR